MCHSENCPLSLPVAHLLQNLLYLQGFQQVQGFHALLDAQEPHDLLSGHGGPPFLENLEDQAPQQVPGKNMEEHQLESK